MKALGNNLFECVYLKSHPALSTFNSDDPTPGSWHSADVFTPHPTIPDVWKYVTRIDDRVTLLNGEKVLPLPIEGRLRQDGLIQEAVVVGVDKAVPGLLIFRAKEGDHLTEDDYVDAIWPSVADANLHAEAFSHISREMVTLFPSGMDCPHTDKRSIIRSQVYEMFDKEIEKMYADVEQSHGHSRLDISALEGYLMTICRDEIGITLESIEVDFFAAGVDSLEQIQMRHLIQRDLELNGNHLSPNVVYDHGNVRRLARYLYAIRNGEQVQQNDDLMLMEQMIAEYSSFPAHNYSNGSLGGADSQATSDTSTNGLSKDADHQIKAATNDMKNLISQGLTMPLSISIDSSSKEQSAVRAYGTPTCTPPSDPKPDSHGSNRLGRSPPSSQTAPRRKIRPSLLFRARPEPLAKDPRLPPTPRPLPPRIQPSQNHHAGRRRSQPAGLGSRRRDPYGAAALDRLDRPRRLARQLQRPPEQLPARAREPAAPARLLPVGRPASPGAVLLLLVHLGGVPGTGAGARSRCADRGSCARGWNGIRGVEAGGRACRVECCEGGREGVRAEDRAGGRRRGEWGVERAGVRAVHDALGADFACVARFTWRGKYLSFPPLPVCSPNLSNLEFGAGAA